MGELVECLARNVSLPTISDVHVFVEDEWAGYADRVRQVDSPVLRRLGELLQDRKVVVSKAGKRMTYRDYFAYANEKLTGRIVIVSNSDIYFDETLSFLDRIDMSGVFVCLGKVEAATGQPNVGQYGSQDSWTFRSPIRPFPCDWSLGLPSCEQRLAHEAHESGMTVVNPCLSIRAYHLHDSGVRHYVEADRVPGPYRAVPASTIEACR